MVKQKIRKVYFPIYMIYETRSVIKISVYCKFMAGHNVPEQQNFILREDNGSVIIFYVVKLRYCKRIFRYPTF